MRGNLIRFVIWPDVNRSSRGHQQSSTSLQRRSSTSLLALNPWRARTHYLRTLGQRNIVVRTVYFPQVSPDTVPIYHPTRMKRKNSWVRWTPTARVGIRNQTGGFAATRLCGGDNIVRIWWLSINISNNGTYVCANSKTFMWPTFSGVSSWILVRWLI